MKFKIAILAAGKGKRMRSNIPKALTPVGGKPILQYLYESVIASGIDGDPIVVIGPERKRLCEPFGGMCEYVVQEEQLGTGHAVKTSRTAVGEADAVIVLNGDEPFVSAQALQKLAERHRERGNTITMMTATIPSYDVWYKAFYQWGRVLRGSNGHIVGIREYKDASAEEKSIRELNPSLFCFKATWLWKNIKMLENKNAQSEYYLTDLIAIAVAQGEKLSSIDVAPEEVIGINTPQERDIAEQLLKTRGISSVR
jgi:bifunctional UDP-N-acetylglucosamine pyrophosphorylase/glucosamine-1-phosphate N-acetyltransferase